DDLHPVGALGTEHPKRAAERIGTAVAHQSRQAVRALPEVDRARRHIDLGSGRDHAERTARIAPPRRAAATPPPTRIVASPMTISMPSVGTPSADASSTGAKLW